MSIAQNYPNLKPSLLLDFANTEQLDPRITFARASTATYYGTQTAKAEENLLLRSQEFDNAAWTKTNSTVTANSTTAPDGTSTAEKVASSVTTTTAVRVNQASFSTASGSSYVLSVFAKKDDINFVVLLDATTNKGKYFNLDTGAVGLDEGGAPAASSITSFGNGWYRCSITVTASTTLGARIYLSSTDGTLSYAATSGQGIFLWGAQLEQRSAVTAYTPTTTQPITNYIPVLQTAAAGVARFEHNPITGESLGLLIEEQRSNLLVRSEEFDNAAWTKLRSSIVANTVVAPDGALTGDKLVENSTNASHLVFQSLSGTTIGTSYTYSFYAKKAERTFVQIYTSSPDVSTDPFVNFDLTNGTATVSGTVTAFITPVGNGWYRCGVTVVAAAGGLTIAITLATSSSFGRNGSYQGDGYSGIYIWGVQLEAGAFPTSYIPTVASQVTRSADAASMTGANFSSWYRADEGTLFSQASSAFIPASTAYGIATVRSTAANAIGIGLQADTNASASIIRSGDVAQAIFGAPTANNQTYKMGLAYATNNAAFSLGGAAVQTDATVVLPVVDALYIGQVRQGTIAGTEHIQRIAFYPKRIANEQLQALTQN
jgi:hypothetical protein